MNLRRIRGTKSEVSSFQTIENGSMIRGRMLCQALQWFFVFPFREDEKPLPNESFWRGGAGEALFAKRASPDSFLIPRADC